MVWINVIESGEVQILCMLVNLIKNELLPEVLQKCSECTCQWSNLQTAGERI
jgi:hypothetical protein